MITFQVHLDFDADGAFTADDDITPFVKSIDIASGIRDPLAHSAAPGVYTLTVNNADRRFSPAYTGGPYYGRLLPNRPLRIQVTDGALIWTLFRGVVRACRPASGEHGPREAVIVCDDLLGALRDHRISLPLQRNKRADELLRLIGAATFRTARAETLITFSGLPADGDTLTVNGLTFTLRVSLTGGANEVLIGSGGAPIETTIDNLVAALDGGEGVGTLYAANINRPVGVVAMPEETYYRVVQRDHPVRHYRLNETSGPALDRGTNGAHGTYLGGVTLGASGATGDADAAASFDGVDGRVSIPTLALARRSFSVEALIRPSASSPPAQQCWFGAHTAALANQSLALRLEPSGVIEADFYGAALQSNQIVTFGVWNHVVFVYDHAADESRWYINGQAAGQSAIGPFEGLDPALTIGCALGGAEFFKGELDELALYLYPLSAEQVSSHHALIGAARGLRLAAAARGAWANAIPLARSSAAMSLPGGTLGASQAGVDGPLGFIDYASGTRTFDLAGDAWSSDGTSALAALDQAVRAEQGLFWAARGGALTFRDGGYLLRRAAATPALTLDSQHNAALGGVESVHNRVVISFTPRATLASGVIARARGVIKVPGLWGKDRFNPADDLPGGGYVVARLPYVDPGTGQFAGAESLTLPLTPGIDYQISDAPDGSGFDYTYLPYVRFTAAVNGADVEVSMRNVALGPLYIRNLQVRGVGIVAYEPQQVIADDAASQDAYGRRALTIDLPLPADGAQSYAEALAAYHLNRSAEPTFRAAEIAFSGQDVVNGVNLYALEIGDVIALTDHQTGAAAQRYLITGFRCRLSAGNPAASEIAFAVRRLDDVRYGVWDDAAYGLWNDARWGI